MVGDSITVEQYERIQDMRCPACYGEGALTALTQDGDEIDVDCPKCESTGYIDADGEPVRLRDVLNPPETKP